VVWSDKRVNIMRVLLLLAVLTSCKAADDYARKSKMSEARLHLNKLTKLAKVYQIEKGQFPVGKAALTPAISCCDQAQHKCQPDPSQWTGVWKDLDFQIDEPHNYRYSYESDGNTFTATAVGDLDCDLEVATFTAHGKFAADGTFEISVDDKPTGND
jgi:hypothetical protein